MRILLITLFFPPKRNAGTENYTLGVAKTLLERGHEVQVLCAGEWETGQEYWNGVAEDLYEGVPVYRIQLNWTKANNPNQVLYSSLQIERWLEHFLDQIRPDVVHVTSAVTLGVGIFHSVQRVGIPLVLTLTDFWFICPSIQLLRSDGSLCTGKTTAWDCQSCLSSASHLMRNVNMVLPASVHPSIWGNLTKLPLLTKQRGLRGILLDMAERKRMLTEALFIPNRIFAPSKLVQQIFVENTGVSVLLLHHGHDLHWCKDYKGKTDSDKLRFGYIGQIQAIKGVYILIEAFQRAHLDAVARLDIWGDLTQARGYVEKVRGLIGDSSVITLRGHFDRTDLATVLSEIDVIVVPSLWYENAPLVIQEAFATKTPVITTNLGGMAEAVDHGINGLLFERGDVADLARQLRRIVNEPELLDGLRAHIPTVKTIDEEVTELEANYRDLIA